MGMPDYLCFETPGEIPIDAFTTFGINAKPNTKNPIGYFGTGLKMAIAVLMRYEIGITIYAGKRTYKFKSQPYYFRDKKFNGIYMETSGLFGNRKTTRLAFTTELAKTWEPWMAFRELEANTRDEDGITHSLNTEESSVMSFLNSPTFCSPNRTMIVVGPSTVFADIYQNRDEIFLPEGKREIDHNEHIQILDQPSSYVYYRGMRVMTLQRPAILTYNLLSTQQLTEDRTIHEQWYIPYMIARHLIEDCNDPQVIKKLLEAGEQSFEYALPIDNIDSPPSSTFLSVANTLKLEYSTKFGKLDKTLIGSVRFGHYWSRLESPPSLLSSRFKAWVDDHCDQDLDSTPILSEVYKFIKEHE